MKGDRSVCGDGLAIERLATIDEDPSVLELRQQFIDGVVQAQLALLDEQQRAYGDDRLGHGRDPEDAVALDWRGLTAGQGPGDTHVDFVSTGGQPRQATDTVVLDMTGHDRAESVETGMANSAHGVGNLANGQRAASP